MGTLGHARARSGTLGHARTIETQKHNILNTIDSIQFERREAPHVSLPRSQFAEAGPTAGEPGGAHVQHEQARPTSRPAVPLIPLGLQGAPLEDSGVTGAAATHVNSGLL